MLNLYIDVKTLKSFAVADEAGATNVWNLLAESVSRLFDGECEVPDGFFMPAGATVTTKKYPYSAGSMYLHIFPYIPDSITSFIIGTTQYYDAVPANRQYQERDDYLVLTNQALKNLNVSIAEKFNVEMTVAAKYGFVSIPVDIQSACIEQALLMWRRKDLSFADISGAAAGAVNAPFSPTFLSTTKRYRDLYSRNTDSL